MRGNPKYNVDNSRYVSEKTKEREIKSAIRKEKLKDDAAKLRAEIDQTFGKVDPEMRKKYRPVR